MLASMCLHTFWNYHYADRKDRGHKHMHKVVLHPPDKMSKDNFPYIQFLALALDIQ
jgi:hypothetical protein